MNDHFRPTDQQWIRLIREGCGGHEARTLGASINAVETTVQTLARACDDLIVAAGRVQIKLETERTRHAATRAKLSTAWADLDQRNRELRGSAPNPLDLDDRRHVGRTADGPGVMEAPRAPEED